MFERLKVLLLFSLAFAACSEEKELPAPVVEKEPAPRQVDTVWKERIITKKIIIRDTFFVKEKSVAKAATLKENAASISYYEIGMLIVKYSEGIRLNEYKCAAGVPTIGWGHTAHPDKVISLSDANEIVKETYTKQYKKLEAEYPHLTHRKLLALASLRFNVGKFGKNLHKAILADDDARVMRYMKKYCVAAGKWLKGLESRRKREAILYGGTEKQLIELRDFLKKHVREKIIKAKNS